MFIVDCFAHLHRAIIINACNYSDVIDNCFVKVDLYIVFSIILVKVVCSETLLVSLINKLRFYIFKYLAFLFIQCHQLTQCFTQHIIRVTHCDNYSKLNSVHKIHNVDVYELHPVAKIMESPHLQDVTQLFHFVPNTKITDLTHNNI